MKKIGAFVGKFLPPHLGHLSIIDRMAKECDECVIVISDSPKNSENLCKNANFPYFNAQKRLNWFKKHYKDNKTIHYAIIDESEVLGQNFMEEYAKVFYKKVPYKVNAKYADESYRELNEKYFKTCTFVPINRDLINVHGTDIRNNYEEYKNFVMQEAREDIEKEIYKN